MSTCHSVAKINNKFVGDPLDIKMFEQTKYDITEKANYTEITNGLERLWIIKTFDFNS